MNEMCNPSAEPRIFTLWVQGDALAPARRIVGTPLRRTHATLRRWPVLAGSGRILRPKLRISATKGPVLAIRGGTCSGVSTSDCDLPSEASLGTILWVQSHAPCHVRVTSLPRSGTVRATIVFSLCPCSTPVPATKWNKTEHNGTHFPAKHRLAASPATFPEVQSTRRCG